MRIEFGCMGEFQVSLSLGRTRPEWYEKGSRNQIVNSLLVDLLRFVHSSSYFTDDRSNAVHFTPKTNNYGALVLER